jgi:hypothetical protein
MIGEEFKEVFNPTTGTRNKQAYYNDFIVSFLPSHDCGMGPETDDGETALIINGKYYILNGDWTLAYSEIASQGADACLAFFHSKEPMFGSSWTSR